ncbi:thaumatin-like protein-like [Dorcoceras hygrometricum]|uniref:Thaumatin-like protein-like n=1 Tax=Dorcoceras hygrometricum TaxID=472368 RepID=A0A2Z7B759_9LAMI|nr:thaumatin-like protein-like [Dorcoceras hygrometricum]
MSNFKLFLFLLFFITSILASDGTQLIVVNNCKGPVWPGILATAGHEALNNGGFRLNSGQQVVVDCPKHWSGRIWARQGCCFDETGKGSCQTGDCAGKLHCIGTGGEPPATLVEMTLGTSSNPRHYYDVSLVDGFNLPVSMIPVGGGRGCGVAACEADLNDFCPEKLAVRRDGKVVGCKSACLATREDRYCCTGEYISRATCKPTAFAHLFKAVCPRAYSYAYDESTGLKTCIAPRYVITFCPPN